VGGLAGECVRWRVRGCEGERESERVRECERV